MNREKVINILKNIKKYKIIIFFIITLYFIGILCITADGLKNDKIPLDKINYGVIYGNKVNLDGEPSNRLKARLDHGIELYKKGLLDYIVVSGGIGKEGFNEAKVMADYLVDGGIGVDSIYQDIEGYTTYETSKNLLKIVSKDKNIVGITQFYHSSRVRLSLRQSGFNNVYISAPKYFEIRDIYSLFRELPAYLKYYFLYRDGLL